MKFTKTILAVVMAVSMALSVGHAATEPKPDHYFNDYAHAVSPAKANELNTKLADYERKTSNQIVVAVYPKYSGDQDFNEHVNDCFQAWGVGQKGKDNGILYMVYLTSDSGKGKQRVEVGRGLEGALPDVTADDIIRVQVGPLFKAKNFDAGFTLAVDKFAAATTTEGNAGNGKTQHDQKHDAFLASVGQHHATNNVAAQSHQDNGFGSVLTVLFYLVLFGCIWYPYRYLVSEVCRR